MPRPLRRRGLDVIHELAPLDRLSLIIGPSPRRSDPAELARLGDLYRRHRGDVWAATDVIPEAAWAYEPDIPADLVARHDAGDPPGRAEFLDRLKGIHR